MTTSLVITRRHVAKAAALFTGAWWLLPVVSSHAENADPLSRDSVLRDSAAPVLGNAEGDLTIVEYFDYQCPDCRKLQPSLADVVREDGNIRFVAKDWPIFGDDSRYAAQLALAAQFQGKYAVAHDALFNAKGKLARPITEELLATAGIDVERAKSDLASHRTEIDALVARNDSQARALAFRGTPALIVGTFRIPGGIDAANLRLAIADARAAAKPDKTQTHTK